MPCKLLVGIALLAGVAWVPSQQPAALSETVIDLGHALSETDPSWSGERVFSRTVLATFEKDKVAMGRFASDEHFGTHFDAPAHFSPKGWTVDRVPADRLVRPGLCLNVVAQALRDADYRVTVADLRAFEQRHGAIPEGAVVLVATGWDSRWPDPKRYMNVRGGVKHFPGLSVEAATFLAKARRVAGIAIDTPSIDYGPSVDYEAHRTTQPLNVYHVENAANLTKLPAAGFTVVVAPIKIAGGSGGPTRIFALRGNVRPGG